MSAVGVKRTSETRSPMSASDPNVWTGRALQEAFRDGEVGLALMYPASLWSMDVLRAMMDIRARPISLADRPLRAI